MLSPSENFVQELSAIQNSLYGYILSLLPDRTAAHDILQEVNLTAWQKSPDFQPGTCFFAWITKIAYFHVLSHRRKMNRDRMVLDDRVLDYLAERQVERIDETHRRSRALRKCLEKIPERHRRLVEQRYAAEGSVQKIAETQGKTVGAISQALFRIRELLLRCIEESLSHEELAS